MTALAKHAARGLNVRVNAKVTAIRPTAAGWQVDRTDGSNHADTVVLTAPVPQALALLEGGAAALDDPAVVRQLMAVDYHPTLALMVVLDRPVTIGHVGAVQLTDGSFGFIADNHAKGISTAPAVTFHASHAVSAALWDDDPDHARDTLLREAASWLGEATVIHVQLKRWRYAQPTAPLAESCLATAVDGRPIVFAGDMFAGSKVEGAFTSGRAAALDLLGQERSAG